MEFNRPIVPEVKFATPAVDIHAKPPHIEAKVTGSPGAPLPSSIIGIDTKKKK